MVFLETALESKLNPLVALGRAGSMGLSGFVNKFNADAELLDDLVLSLNILKSMPHPSNSNTERSLDCKIAQGACWYWYAGPRDSI